MRKTLKSIISLLLAVCLCLGILSACGTRRGVSFKVIAELDQEEFTVAFRKDDPLCNIFTAALRELAAAGQISRLSASYLGADYSCMDGLPEALLTIDETVEPGRKLRIGVQDGVAPICSSRDDGSFTGLIPDLADMVADILGWQFEYMVISAENVAAELGSGNIDAAWMAASFKAEKDSCSLSPGWLKNSHELVVRTDSGYGRKKALKGKILGVTDATSVDALKANEMVERAGAVWYYDDLRTLFNALASGDCDALVIDSAVEAYYM